MRCQKKQQVNLQLAKKRDILKKIEIEDNETIRQHFINLELQARAAKFA